MRNGLCSLEIIERKQLIYIISYDFEKTLDLHARAGFIIQLAEEGIMKRISEVCKITGVTRRTLQEYNKIELLTPTSTTESGYWLYDDAKIRELMFIQMLRAAKYSRKEIKEILDDPDEKLTLELMRDAIHKLEEEKIRLDEEKKRVEEMIEVLQFNATLSLNLPDDLMEKTGISDPAFFFGEGMSFDQANRRMGSILMNWDEDIKNEAVLLTKLVAELFVIGSMRGQRTAQEIIDHIKAFFHSFVDLITEENDDYAKQKEKIEATLDVMEYMEEIADRQDIREKLDNQYGEDTAKLVAQSINVVRNLMSTSLEMVESERNEK